MKSSKFAPLDLDQLIADFPKTDGMHDTSIPELKLIRISEPNDELHMLHQPAICIILQGSKQVQLTDETYKYGASEYLVLSVDLPIAGRVTKATPKEPYLCIAIFLDPVMICDIMVEISSGLTHKDPVKRGLQVSKSTSQLLDPVSRLMRLLKNPKDIAFMKPLVMREILYQLLNDQQSGIVRQIGLAGSQTQRISKVIEILKRDFRKTLRIDLLARAANMSPSALHQHFKEITAMSPLQYQKCLRLQEARRLMMSGSADAASAGFAVGYESPSQFNREYSRMFGLPPIADIRRLKDAA